MPEAWEKVAQGQRTSELIDLIEEQKEKDIEHVAREDAMEKKSADRVIELSHLIETLAKHMLDLEKRVAELEKEVKS
jgi:hypothetical protein